MKKTFNTNTSVFLLAIVMIGALMIKGAVGDINDGLVAYYGFESNSNLGLSSAPGGYNLDNPGAISGAGVKGAGLELDGFSSLQYLGGDDPFDTTSDFTWSIWFRTEDELQGALLAKASEEWSPGAKALFTDDGWLVFDIGWVGAVDFGGGLNDGEWHHAVLIVHYEEEDDDIVELFVDGVFAGEMIEELSDVVEPDNSVFELGGASADFPEPSDFYGDLDEARIYNRALSHEEVLELLVDGYPNLPTPEIEQIPSEITGVAGRSITLGVEAAGLALNYQWFKDDEEIADADEAELTLEELGLDAAGSYHVVISNPSGSTSSDAITVTVLPEWDSSIGLIGHWSFDVADQPGVDASGNNIELDNTGVLQSAGLKGLALDMDRSARMEDITELFEFDTLQSFTWTAMIKTETDGGIISKSPEEWSPGSKALFVRGGKLSFDVGWIAYVESEADVNDGEWHQVAITVENGEDEDVVQLYIDGNADGLKDDWDMEWQPDVGMFRIGYTSDDFPFGELSENFWDGQIDEVRVYNQAITPEDILQLFVTDGGTMQPPAIIEQPAGLEATVGRNVRFEVVASGTGITFQWLKDGEEIEEATTNSLLLAGVSEDDAGAYSVIISNELGEVTSEAALLSVVPLDPSENLAHLIPHLVSYWTFDEKEDDLIPDQVPDSTHAGILMNGAEITVEDEGYGGVGEALEPGYDSENGHMAASDPESYNFNESFTWSAWVLVWDPAGEFDDGSGIIGRAPMESEHNQGSKTFFLSGGSLAFDSGWVGMPISDVEIDDEEWHHVAATYDATIEELTLYADGEIVLQEEFPVNEFDENAEHNGGSANTGFRVGNGANGFLEASFPGLIDEVAIWETVLAPDEIFLLSQGKSPMPEEVEEATISIAQEDGDIIITFTGILQISDSLAGPFVDMPDISSPYIIEPDDQSGMRFARARVD
jgi:hypothetical protein